MNRNALALLGLLCLSMWMRPTVAQAWERFQGLTDSDLTTGTEKYLEILTPKEGFAGAPPTAAAYIPRREIPKKDSDFDRSIVRVTVLKRRLYRDGAAERIVLRCDFVEAPEREVVPWPPFAVIESNPEGCRIAGQRDDPNASLLSMREPLSDHGNEGHEHYGFRFVFLMTSPSLPSREGKGQKDDRLEQMYGVAFTSASVSEGESTTHTVSATLLERTSVGRQYPVERVRRAFFDKERKTLSDAKTSDTEEVALVAREEQVWKGKSSWLWDRMTRYNAEGTLTMRCRQIPCPANLQKEKK
jgi:hypothetical protein